MPLLSSLFCSFWINQGLQVRNDTPHDALDSAEQHEHETEPILVRFLAFVLGSGDANLLTDDLKLSDLFDHLVEVGHDSFEQIVLVSRLLH